MLLKQQFLVLTKTELLLVTAVTVQTGLVHAGKAHTQLNH